MARVKKPDSKRQPTHRFGAHMSIAGGVHNALIAAIETRCDAVQLFVKNQRQWRMPALPNADRDRWHELLATSDVGPAIAHATYLINIASPDRSLRNRSRDALAAELLRCDELDIPYLVFHPGAATDGDTDAGIKRVAGELDRIFDKHPDLRVMPLLETTAGGGNTLGRSFTELGAIIHAAEEPKRLGVCVDTCHVFAAGYDIRNPNVYQTMIKEARRAVGLKRIRCWHLNDSVGECGSRRDRHAHVGEGRIGNAGFRNVLGDPRLRGLPMILETPKGEDDRGRDLDRLNLRRLRSIASRAYRS